MAFGKAANTKKPTEVTEKRDNPFLDTKTGIRIFRLMPSAEELKVKRHWLAQNEDGTWEPKFGYNPNDKRKAVPVTVATYDAEQERWVGSDTRNWRNNPIDRFVSALATEDQKGKYAQEVFFLNVLDLTPVKIDADGNVFYPDDTMKYPAALKDAPKVISNKVKILSGSSGDADGKSLYANLVRLAKGALNDDGDVLSIYDYEIRLVTTGSGKETNRGFNMGAIRPMPDEFVALPVYDLVGAFQAWPNDAIEALMNGADYAEVIKEHNITLYPNLVTPTAPVEDDEALF